jgi:hypothetical protein
MKFSFVLSFQPTSSEESHRASGFLLPASSFQPTPSSFHLPAPNAAEFIGDVFFPAIHFIIHFVESVNRLIG